MIMTFEPVVLHIATEGPLGMAARKYAREYGIEFTSCYHTHFPDYVAKRVGKYLPFLFNPVKTLCIKYIRHFHSISSCLFIATQSLEDNLRQWGFTPPIKRMTRGIDHDVFKVGEKSAFLDVKAPIALYVGRVAIEKNLDDFFHQIIFD
jgi:glycosyltransferase involved in cell wall biosynthesis